MVPENAQETIEPASVAPVHEPDNEIVVHRESITAIYIPCFFRRGFVARNMFPGEASTRSSAPSGASGGGFLGQLRQLTGIITISR